MNLRACIYHYICNRKCTVHYIELVILKLIENHCDVTLGSHIAHIHNFFFIYIYHPYSIAKWNDKRSHRSVCILSIFFLSLRLFSQGSYIFACRLLMTSLPSDVDITDVYILYEIFLEILAIVEEAFLRILYVPGLYHNFYNRAKTFVRPSAEFPLYNTNI